MDIGQISRFMYNTIKNQRKSSITNYRENSNPPSILHKIIGNKKYNNIIKASKKEEYEMDAEVESCHQNKNSKSLTSFSSREPGPFGPLGHTRFRS